MFLGFKEISEVPTVDINVQLTLGSPETDGNHEQYFSMDFVFVWTLNKSSMAFLILSPLEHDGYRLSTWAHDTLNIDHLKLKSHLTFEADMCWRTWWLETGVMNDLRRMWRVPDLVTCLGPVSVLPRNINVYKKVGTETRSNGQTSIFPRHHGPFIFSSQSRDRPQIPESDHSPLIDPHVVSAATRPGGCLRGPDTELVDVSSLAALTLVTTTGAGSVHLTTWKVVSWGHVTLAPALMINMCSGLAATFVEEQI